MKYTVFEQMADDLPTAFEQLENFINEGLAQGEQYEFIGGVNVLPLDDGRYSAYQAAIIKND